MNNKLIDPGVIRFSAVIVQSDRTANSWAWVVFPYDVKKTYGKGNLVPVSVTFDSVSYRGSITKMQGDQAMILIKRDILTQLNKQKGDQVQVSVTLDKKPRTVSIPSELRKLFSKNADAKDQFNKLSNSHKKEYVQWIESAKQAETRERRAKKTIDMLREVKK